MSVKKSPSQQGEIRTLSFSERQQIALSVAKAPTAQLAGKDKSHNGYTLKTLHSVASQHHTITSKLQNFHPEQTSRNNVWFGADRLTVLQMKYPSIFE